MEFIKKIREITGAGIVDCKKALKEAGNDIDKAVEILRKKGITKAAKRDGREAGEGIIKLAVNEAGNEGYMVEVNSETDFVARNERFKNFAEEILKIIENKKPKNLEEIMDADMDKGTVKENLDSLSGIIGEKLGIKRFTIITGATVAGYSHLGGKIGVLVALDKEGQKELAVNIAMQIAAANPKYIKPEEIPVEEINKEKEIQKEILIKEDKPENIIDKILTGKINKYFEEICLVKQEYIKDDKKKVEQIMNGVRVEKFARYGL